MKSIVTRVDVCANSRRFCCQIHENHTHASSSVVQVVVVVSSRGRTRARVDRH